MEKYDVKWNEEIEGFIRKKIEEFLPAMSETKSDSARKVREDRDSN